jgi:hypothetical protein
LRFSGFFYFPISDSLEAPGSPAVFGWNRWGFPKIGLKGPFLISPGKRQKTDLQQVTPTRSWFLRNPKLFYDSLN